MSITIETVAQLTSFVKNEIVTANSATNMPVEFLGVAWNLVKANINLKANTEFDMSGGSDGSGAPFATGSTWGLAGAGQEWKLNTTDLVVGSAGTGLFTFNGKNSTIKNMELDGSWNVGFFGGGASGNGGQQINVKNITFQDCRAYATHNFCGIVGSNVMAGTDDTVEYRPCFNKITVINPRVAFCAKGGGLFGMMTRCQEIKDCMVVSTGVVPSYSFNPFYQQVIDSANPAHIYAHGTGSEASAIWAGGIFGQFETNTNFYSLERIWSSVSVCAGKYASGCLGKIGGGALANGSVIKDIAFVGGSVYTSVDSNHYTGGAFGGIWYGPAEITRVISVPRRIVSRGTDTLSAQNVNRGGIISGMEVQATSLSHIYMNTAFMAGGTDEVRNHENTLQGDTISTIFGAFDNWTGLSSHTVTGSSTNSALLIKLAKLSTAYFPTTYFSDFDTGYHAIVDATTITVKENIQVTIETAAQLTSFLRNEILTANSAKDIESFVDGSLRWDQLPADIHLKENHVFDLADGIGSGNPFEPLACGGTADNYCGSRWCAGTSPPAYGTTPQKHTNNGTELGSDLYTFDGHNATIKNLKMRGIGYTGFFCYTKANVKNLIFKDCFTISDTKGATVAAVFSTEGSGASNNPVMENVHTYNCRVRVRGIGGTLAAETVSTFFKKCTVNSTKEPNPWSDVPIASLSAHGSYATGLVMKNVIHASLYPASTPCSMINDGVEREVEGHLYVHPPGTFNQGVGPIGGMCGTANTVSFDHCSCSVSVSAVKQVGGYCGSTVNVNFTDCSYLGGSIVAAQSVWHSVAVSTHSQIGVFTGLNTSGTGASPPTKSFAIVGDPTSTPNILLSADNGATPVKIDITTDTGRAMLMYGPGTTNVYSNTDASSYYLRHTNKIWKYVDQAAITEVSSGVVPSLGDPTISHVDTKTYYFEHTPSPIPPDTVTNIGNKDTFTAFHTDGNFTAIGHPDNTGALAGAPHRQVWVYKDSGDSYFATIASDVSYFGCNVYVSTDATHVRVFIMDDPKSGAAPGHVSVYTSPKTAANFALEHTFTATAAYNKKYGVETKGWMSDTHEFILIAHGAGLARAEFYRRSLTGTTWESWGFTGQLGKLGSCAIHKINNSKVLIAAGNFESHKIRVGHMPFTSAIVHGAFDYQHHQWNTLNIGEGISISSDGLTVTTTAGPAGGMKNIQFDVDHIDEWKNSFSPWGVSSYTYQYDIWQTSPTAMIKHGSKLVYIAYNSHLNHNYTTGTPLKFWVKDRKEQGVWIHTPELIIETSHSIGSTSQYTRNWGYGNSARNIYYHEHTPGIYTLSFIMPAYSLADDPGASWYRIRVNLEEITNWVSLNDYIMFPTATDNLSSISLPKELPLSINTKKGDSVYMTPDHTRKRLTYWKYGEYGNSFRNGDPDPPTKLVINNATQLKDFLNNAILTNTSAYNIGFSGKIDGTTRWDAAYYNVELKPGKVYNMAAGSDGSGTAFSSGAVWGGNNGAADWQGTSGGAIGTGRFTFDGKGATIKNLKIQGAADNIGFISGNCLVNVKNVTFLKCNVSSTGDNVAIAVAKVTGSDSELAYRYEFSNINTINCKVRGKSSVGHVVGLAADLGTIQLCSSGVSNLPNAFAGSVAASFQPSVVCESESLGTGTTGVAIGGIVGTETGILTISKCSSSIGVSGYSKVGGIIGNSDGSLTISSCSYNGGKIKADSNAAGIIGYAQSDLTIENSYVASASIDVGGEFSGAVAEESTGGVGHILGKNDGICTYSSVYYTSEYMTGGNATVYAANDNSDSGSNISALLNGHADWTGNSSGLDIKGTSALTIANLARLTSGDYHLYDNINNGTAYAEVKSTTLFYNAYAQYGTVVPSRFSAAAVTAAASGTRLDASAVVSNGVAPDLTSSSVEEQDAAVAAVLAAAEANVGAGATAQEKKEAKKELFMEMMKAQATAASTGEKAVREVKVTPKLAAMVLEGSKMENANVVIEEDTNLTTALTSLGVAFKKDNGEVMTPVEIKTAIIEKAPSVKIITEPPTIEDPPVLDEAGGVVIVDLDETYWKWGPTPKIMALNLMATDTDVGASMFEMFGVTLTATDFLSKLTDAAGETYTQQSDATDDFYYWLVIQVTDQFMVKLTPTTVNDLPFQFQIDMAQTEFVSISDTAFSGELSGKFTLQLMAGSTNGSGGTSATAMADPVMSPLFGHPYQLPCDNNSYLLFDNQAQGDDRLVISCQTWILPESERKIVQEYCDKKWNRDCNVLSYMKYVGIFWKDEWTVYDIDNLCIVNGTNNDIRKGTCSFVEDLEKHQAPKESIIKSALPFYGESSNEYANIDIFTQSHGRVRVKLCTYEDLEMRNGIRLQGHNVTMDNSYGCLVSCPNIKSVTMKKLKSLPNTEEKNWEHKFALQHSTVNYGGKSNMVKILKPHRAFDKGTSLILA